MSLKPKYFTKSKFKTGHECPNKLYFLQDRRYGSTKDENDFLKALAEGGFQVGELAKIYHPGGVTVDTLNHQEALEQTRELLKKEHVIIYEPAFAFENLLVRVDILEKKGNSFKIFEVKSKTYDFSDVEASFFQKRDPTKLSSDWEPYLLDVAFQAYVVQQSLREILPKSQCTWNLKLPDKSKVTSVEGLNQRFLILPQNQSNTRIEVAPGTDLTTVGTPLLGNKCIDLEVQALWTRSDYPGEVSFVEYINRLSALFQSQQFAHAAVSSDCKTCEYRISSRQKSEGLLSGFEKCFSEVARLQSHQLSKPFVFDVRFFGSKTKEYFSRKEYLIEQMDVTQIEEKDRDDQKDGWSRSQRQLRQIEIVQKKQRSPEFLKEGLESEIASWKFPLHFIDFETSKVAIPFNQGRRPYEEMAFQFSHHTADEKGTIRHAGQYLNLEKGKFPNFDFVRALKSQLETDQGTIFRYSHHENTVLRAIRQQILESDPTLPDAGDLIAFIDSITSSGLGKKKTFGERCMVDLCDVVERFYLHPLMGGSTSIKKVLPAILNDSEYLQEKYSKPIYGTHDGIVSLNFEQKSWIQIENGQVVDPYKSLPKVFEDYDVEALEDKMVGDDLHDGGAAMTAYARMQFSQMDLKTTNQVKNALLRYCELDTFAMVLIWEYWTKDLLVNHRRKQKAA